MEKFSEILKDFVLESGKSLRQIEKESGVASSQISRDLKNTIPSLEIAIKLSQYFNCTLDYLFGLSDIQGQASTEQFNLTRFINKYEKLLDDNNITHWAFSKKYNLSESCLRHWRNGEYPSISSLILISVNLNITLVELVFG